ncbi:GNAT family N-acetyltransferase [Halogeometricum luteum]|uniref:GNAT family N-acetyltransferase n=1 Tax=Halogeometricum luteum TaxID=2950537 RepID=A0ABU2G0U8_9EURY|nr:GNAT family N-acetyltransferase [Halogeometricum sp. S3BR5-2]MDS0294410.1 GNAT family N-acetyltransferase [Halogeometricum sp. S3BR5-2]
MDDDYELVRGTPDPETFCALREAAGLSARSLEGARRGLPNTLFGVRAERRGEVVGMARVVGDGGTVYEIVDVAVDPAHQGRGLGSAMVEELVGYLDREAPPRAYVSLLADVEGFYERWGFERTAPGSRGMFRRVDADGRFSDGGSES